MRTLYRTGFSHAWCATATCGEPAPIGRHRYFHKLYALDTVLPDLKRPDKAALKKAMQAHVLAQAVLLGTYQKRAIPAAAI